LIEAYAYIDADTRKATDKKLTRLYRTSVIDDYRVVVTIEYTIIPTHGFKLTTTAGGKGIICSIMKSEEMPVDADGNRADIIMENPSVVSRMNPGVLYEQYFGCIARDVSKDIKQMFGLDRNAKVSEADANRIVKGIQLNNPELIQSGINHYLSLYRLVSNTMYDYYSSSSLDVSLHHLTCILNDGIYLHMPVDSDIEYSLAVDECEKTFNTVYGPVSFTDKSGNRVVTKYPVRIGPVYMLLLEKISDDGSSVSSAKLSATGIITTISKNEKFTLPIKEAAIRVIGETEGRIYASYLKSPEGTIEALSRNMDPLSHAEVMRSILKADNPTNIERAVDRSMVGYNGNKALLLTKSILGVIGVKLVNK
jgi:hypothetical protein